MTNIQIHTLVASAKKDLELQHTTDKLLGNLNIETQVQKNTVYC